MTLWPPKGFGCHDFVFLNAIGAKPWFGNRSFDVDSFERNVLVEATLNSGALEALPTR